MKVFCKKTYPDKIYTKGKWYDVIDINRDNNGKITAYVTERSSYMESHEYRFIFYLDAIHSIEINDKRGDAHRHTWKIGITVSKLKEHFIIFNEFEKIIDDFLARYQDKNLD